MFCQYIIQIFPYLLFWIYTSDPDIDQKVCPPIQFPSYEEVISVIPINIDVNYTFSIYTEYW